jgi:LysM repeat protein
MSNSGDETKRGQDPKKVALAIATLPITIIGSIGGTDDFAQASEMRQQSNDGDSQDPDSATEPAEDQDRPAKSLARQSVYEVAPGDTVALIAKKFAIGKSELMRINKLNESSLIMPGQVLRLVDNAVQPSVIEKTLGPVQHTVKQGETLSQIGNRYSIKLPTLLALNQLKERSIIFPGQRLTVRSVNPASVVEPSGSSKEHVVATGETLTQIAKRHSVSLATLLKANRLTKTSMIFVGQRLDVPSASAATADQTKANVSGNTIGKPTKICLFHGFHKIKAGETISKLAGVFGVSTQALLSANNLTLNSTIFVGQKLVVPAVHNALNCPKLTPLTDEMRQNAAAIISIGRQLRVGDYAIVIALATAMQESSLRNISFGDRDSVGLFQQRPSAGWGSKSQIMKPEFSIRAFFGGPTGPNRAGTRGLLDIPNWGAMSLTDAAQAVQISAHPTAYAKWEPSAWNWLAELDGLEDS